MRPRCDRLPTQFLPPAAEPTAAPSVAPRSEIRRLDMRLLSKLLLGAATGAGMLAFSALGASAAISL